MVLLGLYSGFGCLKVKLFFIHLFSSASLHLSSKVGGIFFYNFHLCRRVKSNEQLNILTVKYNTVALYILTVIVSALSEIKCVFYKFAEIFL